MNMIPIQVTQEEVIIPLTYFPEAEELELVVNDKVAVVRVKNKTPKLSVNKRRAEMRQEKDAFNKQRQELMQRFPGEYAAIHKGQLVDHDLDHTQLVRRISVRFPDQVVLIQQITERPLPKLRLGSPRLIR